MIQCVQLDSQSWKALPWKKFHVQLFGLQVRVFKATQRNDKKTVIGLQKLIANSSSARYIAINKVLNKYRFNYNNINNLVLNDKDLQELEKKLKERVEFWKKHTKFKVNQTSKNREKNIFDLFIEEAWQYLYKFMLDPILEKNFHRDLCIDQMSVQEFQKRLCDTLNSLPNSLSHTILEVNMKNLLYKVNPNQLIKTIIAPQKLKLGLLKYLKLIKDNRIKTDKSKLLNTLLENIIFKDINSFHNTISYSNSKLFFVSNNKIAEMLVKKINTRLTEVELDDSFINTQIVLAKNDFTFLKWKFKYNTYSKKYISIPSKENFEGLKKKIKSIVTSASMKIEERVSEIANVIIKWKHYNKNCYIPKEQKSLWGIKNKSWKIFNSKKRNKKIASQLLSKAFPII